MKRSDLSLTIALCLSLLLHGIGFIALAEKYARSLYNQLAVLNSSGNQNEKMYQAPGQGVDSKEMPALPIIQTVKRPPPVEEPLFEELFGESKGKGDALNSTVGETPMQAAQADQAQSFVSHNPVPNPGPGEPVAARAGNGGNGGNGGQPGLSVMAVNPESAAGNPAPPRPRAGSVPAAIAMLTRPTEDPAPLGLPPTAAPPPVMAPRPLRVVRPDLIAIADSTRASSPTTQETDKTPPTTQSVAIDDHSPTTAPVDVAPTTRPSVLVAQAATPTTGPTLDKGIEHPAQELAANVPPVIKAPTTAPVGLPAPNPSTAPVADAPLKEPTTLPVLADAPKPTTLPVTVAIGSPVDMIPLTDESRHAAPAQPVPPPSPAPTGGGIPGFPGGAARGGDGGNQGDTESDPFAKNSNVVIFVNGRVDARTGRKVKTFRPHLTDAGQLALLGMEKPRVILTAKIDETGKVVDVKVVESSGSEEVDLPAYKCLWKWEFEPTRDKSGKAIPDVMIIPFVWK